MDFAGANSTIDFPRQGRPERAAEVRPFASEAALIDVFIKAYKKQKLTRESFVLREFDCANGIADMVLVELGKTNSRSARLGNITPRWLYALHALPYRKLFALDSFVEMTGVTKRRAQVAMREYEAAGFCMPGKEANTWKKVWEPRPIATKIFAVEAKLRDWRRALAQAIRYKDFAHASWVLLDEAFVLSAAQNLSEFERCNIGVAACDLQGNISVLFRPTVQTPQSVDKFWLATSLIAKQAILHNLKR
jgi:hypothetical protein